MSDPVKATRVGSEPMRHWLKTWPEYFAAVKSGVKQFEWRRDDRDFRVGDVLTLREWNPESEKYSGEAVDRRIGYILRESGFAVPSGYAVLGFEATRSPETAPPTQWNESKAVHKATVEYDAAVLNGPSSFDEPIDAGAKHTRYLLARVALFEAFAASITPVPAAPETAETREGVTAALKQSEGVQAAKLEYDRSRIEAYRILDRRQPHVYLKAMDEADASFDRLCEEIFAALAPSREPIKLSGEILCGYALNGWKRLFDYSQNNGPLVLMAKEAEVLANRLNEMADRIAGNTANAPTNVQLQTFYEFLVVDSAAPSRETGPTPDCEPEWTPEQVEAGAKALYYVPASAAPWASHFVRAYDWDRLNTFHGGDPRPSFRDAVKAVLAAARSAHGGNTE